MGDFYYAKISIPNRFMTDDVKHKFAEYFGRDSIENIDDAHVEMQGENGVWKLSDGMARNGEFGEIEEYLVANNIPFDRWTESTGSCNPAYRRLFRPSTIDQEIPETDSGAVVDLKRLHEINELDSPEEIAAQLNALLKECDPESWIPSLESYNEVKDDDLPVSDPVSNE